MNEGVTIVMYHYVRSLSASRYPGIKGLELSRFREQLEFFKSEGARFIGAQELLGALDGGFKPPPKAVLLTFDDGYIDHYTNVFPILRLEGIPAFFSMPGRILAERRVLDVNKIHFVLASLPVGELLPMVMERLDHYRGKEFEIPPNEELYRKLAAEGRFDPPGVIFIKRLLQAELEETLRNRIVDELFRACVPLPEEAFAEELYMSYDQVRLMRQEGMDFGIHGYDHYWMNRLTPQALDRDVALALEVFGGIVDPKRWICCYPYGSCSDDVIRLIRKRGAAAGVTTEADRALPCVHDRFRLPRYDTNDFPPKTARPL